MSLRNELVVDQDVEQTGSTSLNEDAFAEQSSLLEAQGEYYISGSNSRAVPRSVPMAKYENADGTVDFATYGTISSYFSKLECKLVDDELCIGYMRRTAHSRS